MRIIKEVHFMTYGHAILGESLELCREAAAWVLDECERREKNESAREELTVEIEEMLEKQRHASQKSD